MYKEELTAKETKIKETLVSILKDFAKDFFKVEDGKIMYFLSDKDKDYYCVIALPEKLVKFYGRQGIETLKAWSKLCIFFDARAVSKFPERILLLKSGSHSSFTLTFEHWKMVFSSGIVKFIKTKEQEEKENNLKRKSITLKMLAAKKEKQKIPVTIENIEEFLKEGDEEDPTSENYYNNLISYIKTGIVPIGFSFDSFEEQKTRIRRHFVGRKFAEDLKI